MPAHLVHSELARASHAIHAATGVQPGLFRAPYGSWSAAVISQCEHMRMVPLDWSVDPRGWAQPGTRSIIRTIMDNTQPGSIILEHDGGGNRSQTVAALRIVLAPTRGLQLPDPMTVRPVRQPDYGRPPASPRDRAGFRPRAGSALAALPARTAARTAPAISLCQE